MRFVIPFAYRASYRHYRHWYHESVQLESKTVVDIGETDVPGRPAFEIGYVDYGPYSGRRWQRFRLFGDRPGRVWRLEEGCFAEYCEVQEFEGRTREEGDHPFESVSPFPGGREKTSSYEQLSAEKRVMEWDDDGGAAKAASIALRAAEMRIVDGMVCVSVNEPVVVVVVGDAVSVGLAEWSERTGDYLSMIGHRPVPTRRYRLENLDEAERYARKAARERGLAYHSHVVVDHAEPRPPRLCQEGEHLYRTAKALDWTMKYCRFPLSEDQPSGVTFNKVLAETPDQHATEALANASEAVLDDLRRVCRDDLSFRDSLHLLDTTSALEADIQSWRNREFHSDDFTGLALPMPAAGPAVSQILSRAALYDAAAALNIPLELLEREHALGNLLVLFHGKVSCVVVVTPALAVKCIYGKYARPLDVEDETLAAFLAENRSRHYADEDDMEAIASSMLG